MKVLIESHTQTDSLVPYREKLEHSFSSACWALKSMAEVGLFYIESFHNVHNQHVQRLKLGNLFKFKITLGSVRFKA